ncbi:hypothetical protein JZ751_027288 [Albula glossodonta]|uniref:Uncharacterized protein n=1 Tax=Albula glossodonta TaxID=121402 RepID=A0A8T2MNW0_9TELE|nr:hypothetical protein JZ751_027288 [Albula glossodonta]
MKTFTPTALTVPPRSRRLPLLELHRLRFSSWNKLTPLMKTFTPTALTVPPRSRRLPLLELHRCKGSPLEIFLLGGQGQIWRSLCWVVVYCTDT